MQSETFTRSRLYTEEFLTPRNIYTQKLLDRDTCTLRNFYTEKLHTQKFFHTGAFTHRSFCAQTPLHKGALTDTSFTRRSFYTQQLLHKEVFSQRFLDTEELLHRDDALTHKPFLRRSFYTEEPFHRAAFTRFKAAFRRHGMGWHAAKPRTPAPNFRHSWYASCRSSICLISWAAIAIYFRDRGVMNGHIPRLSGCTFVILCRLGVHVWLLHDGIQLPTDHDRRSWSAFVLVCIYIYIYHSEVEAQASRASAEWWQGHNGRVHVKNLKHFFVQNLSKSFLICPRKHLETSKSGARVWDQSCWDLQAGLTEVQKSVTL